MSDDRRVERRAMGQLGSDRPEGRAPRTRSAVPVGVERVLLAAAGDERFRSALLADRAAALARTKVQLRPAERALLLAIPGEQLRAAIAGLDVSAAHRGRRRFMGAIAASAAAVVGAEVLSGCERAATGSRPDYDYGADGPATDSGADTTHDATGQDVEVWVDGMAATGIRPDGSD